MDSIGETPEALAQATAALREQLVAAADPTEPEASDTFLHRFIRWAKMDPTKACERYTDYWAKLRELFPSGAISATDSDGLVATLRLGVYEIPPVRDRWVSVPLLCTLNTAFSCRPTSPPGFTRGQFGSVSAMGDPAPADCWRESVVFMHPSEVHQ